MDDIILNFNYPTDTPKIVKVIDVGGGGGNAVTHMYKEGIHDVAFMLCNTDNQALNRSDVPIGLLLRREIAQGLGAGNKPERAAVAAEESLDDLRGTLNDGTKMVFTTTGMGGGTSAGVAPVIIRTAEDMGVLTVGTVTIPFLFEGERKVMQTLNNVEEIAKNVDASLVINNERLREVYLNLSVMNVFDKADDALTIAAKSVAEIVTLPGIINFDLIGVNTTTKNGGVVLMSNGFGGGEGRIHRTVEGVLNSPLLSSSGVKNAEKILLNVYSSEKAELRMEGMNDMHNFMSEFSRDIEVIWGTAVDNTLGNKVKMTILATESTVDDTPLIADKHRNEAAQMTEEELRLEEEQIERERKEHGLIDKYYGASAQRASRFTSRAKAIVLTQEELGDDALITLIEDNPTYNRDPKVVARARSKVAGEDIQVSTPVTAKQPANQPRQDSQRGGKQVISPR